MLKRICYASSTVLGLGSNAIELKLNKRSVLRIGNVQIGIESLIYYIRIGVIPTFSYFDSKLKLYFLSVAV